MRTPMKRKQIERTTSVKVAHKKSIQQDPVAMIVSPQKMRSRQGGKISREAKVTGHDDK